MSRFLFQIISTEIYFKVCHQFCTYLVMNLHQAFVSRAHLLRSETARHWESIREICSLLVYYQWLVVFSKSFIGCWFVDTSSTDARAGTCVWLVGLVSVDSAFTLQMARDLRVSSLIHASSWVAIFWCSIWHRFLEVFFFMFDMHTWVVTFVINMLVIRIIYWKFVCLQMLFPVI